MEQENYREQASYLRGLLEGLNKSESADSRLLGGIVSLLEALSAHAEATEKTLEDMNVELEGMDDILMSILEDEEDWDEDWDDDLFGDDEDDEDEDDEDDADTSGTDQLHLLHFEGRNTHLTGALCPECNRFFYVDRRDPLGARYTCPHCGKTILPVPVSPSCIPTAKPLD